ncbi:MAG: PD40 domain-containing protein [Ahniella sp.]|nr:PD40 domain-containing protein [Ahniella sp.]
MADQRLLIGSFEVDLIAREVIDPDGAPAHRITDKARAVLVELIAAQGQVVKREQLMDRVWAGTCPTGDVLTQAVTTLRKAFRDDAEKPRYIETIAKTGYRLLAEVTVLDKPVRPVPSLMVIEPETPELDRAASVPSVSDGPPVPRSPFRWLALLGGLLVLGLGGVWIMSRSEPKVPDGAERVVGTSPAATPAVIIAAAPDHEYSPKLSPDGSRVVYSAIAADADHARLIVQPASPGGGRFVLTDSNDQLSDSAAVWSSDGQNIAFLRRGDTDECTLMMVSSVGGLPRALGDCRLAPLASFDLAPDSNSLLMALRSGPDRDDATIHRLDVRTGEWMRLPYTVSEGDVDFAPRFSPDGKFVVFRRGLSAGDLWVMPSEGGDPRRITHLAADIRGLDFVPDGRAVVFSAVVPEGLGLYHVDLETGQLSKATVEWAIFPDIAPNGAMVFERAPERLQLIGFDRTTGERSGQLFSSSATDMMVSFSPDGRRAALYSNRSGALHVWIADVTRPDRAEQVADLTPIARFAPSWSADSQRLIVHGEGVDGLGLYEVDVPGLRARKLALPEHEYRFGLYLGERLVVGWVGEREGELALMQRVDDTWQELARTSGVASAQYDVARQRLLFTKVGRSGLYVMNESLQDEQVLLEQQPLSKYYRRWVVSRSGEVLLPKLTREGCQLLAAPLSDLRAETLRSQPYPYCDAGGMAEHPDGRLVLSVLDGQGSDIGFLAQLPEFRPVKR